MKRGDNAYIIESNRVIRSVRILNCADGLYLVKFLDSSGAIRVHPDRLYNIGGVVEERRLNTMKRINNEVEYVVQDNSDLENMQLLYEKLPLSRHDRDIIDSIFAAYNPGMKRWNDWHIMLVCLTR